MYISLDECVFGLISSTGRLRTDEFLGNNTGQKIMGFLMGLLAVLIRLCFTLKNRNLHVETIKLLGADCREILFYFVCIHNKPICAMVLTYC